MDRQIPDGDGLAGGNVDHPPAEALPIEPRLRLPRPDQGQVLVNVDHSRRSDVVTRAKADGVPVLGSVDCVLYGVEGAAPHADVAGAAPVGLADPVGPSARLARLDRVGLTVTVSASQTWQVGHGGSQPHRPQSTCLWQLFLTTPHLPAQVVARGFGLQRFLRFFLCRSTTMASRRLAAVRPGSTAAPPSRGSATSALSTPRRLITAVNRRASRSNRLSSMAVACSSHLPPIGDRLRCPGCAPGARPVRFRTPKCESRRVR
jgi:hypothetical protein